MLEQAYARLKDGYFEEAVELFSAYLLSAPDQAQAYAGRGSAYFQLHKWPSAASDFLKAKELDASDAEHWIGLAMSLAMENKIYEAIGVFEALLSDRPQHVRAHIQLAQLYYRLGVITKGHKQLDAALASRPSLVERRTIEELKKEQLALDKRRYYRPDFEALRHQNRTTPSGLLKKIKSLFGKS